MEKAIPILLYGLSRFVVFFPQVSFLLMGVTSSMFALSLRKGGREELSLFLLFLLLSLSVFSRSYALSELWYGPSEPPPLILTGKVVSSPKHRGGSSLGYTLSLKATGDGKGNYATAKGTLYVISLAGDEDFGDTVTLSGEMRDGYFLARSVRIDSRSLWGRGRRRFLSLLMRNQEKGSAGRISSLLLTGSSLDGVTELQDKAKQMGLSHLFALSGMHLAFLSLLLSPSKFFFGKRDGKVFMYLVLFLFLYINGFSLSLLRAFLFLLLSSFFPRGWSYALSFPIVLILFPHASRDAGAMLSYVSLFGILIVTEKGKKGLFTPFVVSIGALSSSVPFSFSLFGAWSLSAIILTPIFGFLVEGVFLLAIIRNIIPKLDYIIELIYGIILAFPERLVIPLQYDLKYYWPLLSATVLYVLAVRYLSFVRRWIIIKTCGISTTTARRK